jgi:hypothetical protein
VQAVEKARAALAQAPSQDDPAAASLIKELSQEGYKTVRSEPGHYTLLTNVKGAANDAAVKRRLARMEDTYHAFFYWFALRGKPQPPPAHRLVAVLVKTDGSDTREFESKRAVFDQAPMVADGFTARRENVVVMASSRTDHAYLTLKANNDILQKQTFKISAADLLTDRNIQTRRSDLGGTLARLQTLALLQAAMEEESEIATVTHECIRQLVTATDLLPRYVASAEWLRFGTASFFETPHQAFFPNFGGKNNWTQLINFKYLRKAKKLNDRQAREVLLNVITDHYFANAHELQRQLTEAGEEPPEKLARRTSEATDLARSTAWALTYFLAREHSDKFVKYFQELRSLPRDVEYGADTLKYTFARAFGLLTREARPGQRPEVDLKQLDQLAHAWFKTMETEYTDLVDVERDLVQSRLNPRPTPPQPKTGTPPYGQPGGQPPYGMPGVGRPGYGQPGAQPYPPYGPGAQPGGSPSYNPYGQPGGVQRPPGR